MSLNDVYIPDVWNGAGDTVANRNNMDPRFRNGLLHLVYWLLYTQDGRTFMHGLIPGVGGATTTSIRTPLINKFNEFNVTGAPAEALIGAHIAGFAWLTARNAQTQDTAAMAEQESIFKQHLAAVSWFLWDEGNGPIFSLGW